MDSSIVKLVYGPLSRVNNYLLYELEPWNVVKVRYIINMQKGGTVLFCLWLMYYFNNFSAGAWLYMALHGTYGFCWLTKDFAFPDKSFDFYTSLPTIISTFVILATYWSIPYMQISGLGIQDPSHIRMALSIALFALGVTWMIGADAQKTFTLKYRKGLINDGLFAYTRNPNYLGEIMIYLSFAICTGLTESYLLLIAIWLLLFVTRMYSKDQSFSQKKGWKGYQKRSWVLLPKLVPDSDLITAGIYIAAGVLVWGLVKYTN